LMATSSDNPQSDPQFTALDGFQDLPRLEMRLVLPTWLPTGCSRRERFGAAKVFSTLGSRAQIACATARRTKVIPSITGSAFFTSGSKLILQPGDPLRAGISS